MSVHSGLHHVDVSTPSENNHPTNTLLRTNTDNRNTDQSTSLTEESEGEEVQTGGPPSPSSERAAKRMRMSSPTHTSSTSQSTQDTPSTSTSTAPSTSSAARSSDTSTAPAPSTIPTSSTSTSTAAATPPPSSSSTSSSTMMGSSSSKASEHSKSIRISTLRLSSDLAAVEKDPVEGIDASPIDTSNLYIWRGAVFGPSDTAWEGGIFELQLTFPIEYPQKPPSVRFTSKIYHPNVFSDGTLCLDIIQDQWSPIYTVSTILTSIQSLLTDPNTQSPANPEAAKLYATDKKAYHKKVRAIVSKQQG